MDNKKFEQLIDYIINEDEDKARTLFHDIVVEKSREIYESIMDEELEENAMDGSQVGDLLDEISSEEQGMTEDDEEFADIDMGDGDEVEMTADEFGDEADGEEEELEDRVVDLEDKLDQLMAEFEEIMGDDGSAHADEEGDEFDADEEEFGDEEEGDDFAADEEGEEVMEAIQLQQVKGLYGSKIGGDNGQQTKSPVTANSGQAGMASKPVRTGDGSESVPTGPKKPSNAYAKGETQVKGAGSFKNAPSHKTQDLSAAPKPTTSQASGVNTKSPVSESKRITKRTVR